MESEGARPRKYYRLTDAGRVELVGQSAEWRRIATSLTAFLDRSGA